jgi:quinol monooxygenase YgiN
LPVGTDGHSRAVSGVTGLLVDFIAEPGHADDVERLLESSLEWVESEPRTLAWFGIRYGHNTYGIVDVFTSEQGRQDHLDGPVVKTIASRADELFVDPPRIRRFDVLAHKMPWGSTVVSKPAAVTKGVLLSLPPRRGKGGELAHFLAAAQPLVEQEEDTTAWFAFRLDDGDEGIFDVFPSAGGRFAHLTGQVPRALLRRGLGLLGGLPHLQLVSVVAATLPE